MRHRSLILMLAGALASVGASPTAPADLRIDTRTVQSGDAFFIPGCPYWLCGPPPPHCGGPNNPCPK
jgi:hypothetical protein